MNWIEVPSRQVAATVVCGVIGTLASNFLQPQSNIALSGALLVLISGLSASVFVCAVAGVFRSTLRVASGITQSIFLILISLGSIATLPPEPPSSGVLSVAIVGAESQTQKAAVARLAQDALHASSAEGRQTAAKLVYTLSGQIVDFQNADGLAMKYVPSSQERLQVATIAESVALAKSAIDDLVANEFKRQGWKLIAGLTWLVSFGVTAWWIMRRDHRDEDGAPHTMESSKFLLKRE